METIEIFQRLSLALAIGLLVGLERGWQAREEPEGERAAGLRTHALAGLLGGISATLAQRVASGGGLLLGIAFAVFAGTIVLFRYRETVRDETVGATTAVAALVVFALGALAALGDMAVAAAGGVAVAGLLALKSVLHGWLRRLTWIELRSVLMLLAMTFLLLPVLPNRAVDPLGTINPFQIWLLTVLIAAISFAGYVAVKVTGARRGIALTGLAGGLASSTAVTLMLAQLARKHPERQGLMAGGALLAGAVMLVRVMITVGVVETSLLVWLALPLLLAAAAMAGGGLLLVSRPPPGDAPRADAEIELSNPLDLAAVLQFGALLTVIGVLAQIATRTGGSAGAYVLAAISGLADVDALTLSMARLAGDGIVADVAAVAIAIAVVVNTATKAGLAWATGGRVIGMRMGMVSLVALAAGLIGYLASPLPFELIAGLLERPVGQH